MEFPLLLCFSQKDPLAFFVSSEKAMKGYACGVDKDADILFVFIDPSGLTSRNPKEIDLSQGALIQEIAMGSAPETVT